MRRSWKLMLAACAASGVFSDAAAAATIDPERDATTPTGWSWSLGRSETQINDVRKTGMRLTDIEVESTSPYRFSGVFVNNKGTYARTGGWWFGVTATKAVELTKDANRRMVDLETYTVDGQRRFAIVTVKNTGKAAKAWWWNYDLTVGQVTADINKHGLRLVDLNAYKVGKKLRYSYVGVKNSGVDSRAWWWYPSVTSAFVQKKADQNGARVLDVERLPNGKLAVIMVKSEGQFTLLNLGSTAEKLGQMTASQGVRITDLEKVGSKYTALTLDNATPETARIRGIMRKSPYFNSYFGAYSKAVGGPSYVTLGHDSLYQPMSVMKLVPFLYVMDRVDNGLSLDTTDITWKRPPGQPDAGCPAASGNMTFSDKLRGVLDRAMKESLNRAHESLLDTYTPEAIVNFVRTPAIGLSNTQMYYGCERPGKKLWLDSRTTLADMGKLFEGVETKAYFTKHWQTTRDEFYGIMASWPSEWFRAVVTEEADKVGKHDKINEFLSKLDIKGKGGGTHGDLENGKYRMGRAFSYRVSIPWRQADGTLATRALVGGYFGNDILGPCIEDSYFANPGAFSAECATWAKAMQAAFGGFAAEVQRIPIREALKRY